MDGFKIKNKGSSSDYDFNHLLVSVKNREGIYFVENIIQGFPENRLLVRQVSGPSSEEDSLKVDLEDAQPISMDYESVEDFLSDAVAQSILRGGGTE